MGGGSARNYGVLCAVLGAFGFSFKSVLIRSAYRYGVDAETLLCLRMGYSLPLLLLMAFALEHVPPTALSRRDWFELSVLGVFGYYLSSYLDFMGLRYITAALERVVLFIYPTLVVMTWRTGWYRRDSAATGWTIYSSPGILWVWPPTF